MRYGIGMRDRALPALVVVCLLVMSWFIYDLKSEVQQLRQLAQNNQNQAANTVNVLNPALAQIQQNQVSSAAGLHYLELLLEGLVRHDGLPIDKARDAFKKRAGGVPAGWNWNTPWETPAESVPAK
jgi:hypothetical protein